MFYDKREAVSRALAALNRERVRATYQAMGQYVGLPARSVSSILPITQYGAVVVRGDTGFPGSGGATLPQDLYGSPILRSGDELQDLVAGTWQNTAETGNPPETDILTRLGIDLDCA
jgi:hypothetical protein